MERGITQQKQNCKNEIINNRKLQHSSFHNLPWKDQCWRSAMPHPKPWRVSCTSCQEVMQYGNISRRCPMSCDKGWKRERQKKKKNSISKALLKMQTTMSITYLRTVFYAEVRVLLVDIQSETFNYFSPLVTSLILLFSILVSGICLFYFLLLFDFDF